MGETKLSKKLKELRIRKGFSQEELADKTCLSLRTIQRIENGETEPRGDSLRRLTSVFGISSDEILDWNEREDKSVLQTLNLSALSFLLFPLLGVLVPLVIWVLKKDTVRGFNSLAKKILTFQTVWCICVFLLYVLVILFMQFEFRNMQDVSPTIISHSMRSLIIGYLILSAVNIAVIIYNSIRISRDEPVHYFPMFKRSILTNPSDR